MLILSRRVGETLRIGRDITLTVVAIRGRYVRIGIEAPKHLAVHRQEVFERICAEQSDPGAVAQLGHAGFRVRASSTNAVPSCVVLAPEND